MYRIPKSLNYEGEATPIVCHNFKHTVLDEIVTLKTKIEEEKYNLNVLSDFDPALLFSFLDQYESKAVSKQK